MSKRVDVDERWAEEYEVFLQSEAVPPPAHLSEAVCRRVYKDLNPSALRVFAKLCLSTVMGGLLSLAFCPQFGLGLTQPGSALMGFFEGLGETGCTLACGAIFLGTSTAIAGVILRIEEIRLIRRRSFLQIPCMALLVLSAFVCAGAEVLIGYAVLWWLGAVVAGITTLEVSSAVRLYLWKHPATL